MSNNLLSSSQKNVDPIPDDINNMKELIANLREQITRLENENALLKQSSLCQNDDSLKNTTVSRNSTPRQCSTLRNKRCLEDEKKQKRLEEEEKKELKRRLEQEKKEQKRRQEEERELKRRQEEEKKEQKRREEEERKESKRREEEEKKEIKRREEEDKKEQKRREEEEVEDKKRRQAEKFINFFQKVDKKSEHVTTMWSNSRFKPFEIKEGMSLAPTYIRSELTKQEYDSFLNFDEFNQEQSLYIKTLKNNKTFKKIKKLKNDFDVVPIIGGNINLTYVLDVNDQPKMKLLQFFENHRPAYYGTWRKKSLVITGRKPFCNKEKSLNYEYDSDQDWEEEPSDAEECKSDEEDNENEEEDDPEENDGFFVEHAYLSSDEGSENSEIEDNERYNMEVVEEKKKAKEAIDSLAGNHEQRKHRLAQRAEEWKESQKQKVKKFRKCHIIPTIFGPSWEARKPGDGELPPALEALRLQSMIIPFHKLINPLSTVTTPLK